MPWLYTLYAYFPSQSITVLEETKHSGSVSECEEDQSTRRKRRQQLYGMFLGVRERGYGGERGTGQLSLAWRCSGLSPGLPGPDLSFFLGLNVTGR